MHLHNLARRLNRLSPSGKPKPKSRLTFDQDKDGNWVDPLTKIAYTAEELRHFGIRPLFTTDTLASL